MKIVRRGPGKFLVFVGGKAFVLRVSKKARLVPRWRVAEGLFASSLFAGAGFGLQQPLIGIPMLAVAFVCLWMASR